jgi:hypothetical protein
MTPRDFAIHRARVYLVEARRSRDWHSWHAKLLGWAAKARREATQARQVTEQRLMPW